MAYVRHQEAKIIYRNQGGHNLCDMVSQTMMKLLQENHKGNAKLMNSVEVLKQTNAYLKQSIDELKQSIDEQKQSIKETKDILRVIGGVIGGVGYEIRLRFVRNYERKKMGQIIYHGIDEGNVAAHEGDFPADTGLFLQIPASLTSQDEDAYKSLYGVSPKEGLELCC